VGGRILLIDDDEPFRKLVTIMLTTAGYGVQERQHGPLVVNSGPTWLLRIF
jgi:DNA-binding response OmpR family regulator